MINNLYIKYKDIS
jgi:hypothetical protein